MNKNETFFIYLTEKTFNQYFFKQSPKINKAHLIRYFKEGDLFKVPVPKKLYLILEVAAGKYKITIDEAFLKLLNTGDKFQQEQTNLRLSSKLYQEASRCKKNASFEKAIKLFNHSIKLCAGKPYMNKIKGGAFFHLGDIAYIQEKYKDAKNLFTKSLQYYPKHKKSAQYLKEIKENKNISL